jgi:hypothetical protein
MISGRASARSSATVVRDRAKADTAIASNVRKCSRRPRECASGRNCRNTEPRGTVTASRAAVTLKA